MYVGVYHSRPRRGMFVGVYHARLSNVGCNLNFQTGNVSHSIMSPHSIMLYMMIFYNRLTWRSRWNHWDYAFKSSRMAFIRRFTTISSFCSCSYFIKSSDQSSGSSGTLSMPFFSRGRYFPSHYRRPRSIINDTSRGRYVSE
jgi:hypothetical protein